MTFLSSVCPCHSSRLSSSFHFLLWHVVRGKTHSLIFFCAASFHVTIFATSPCAWETGFSIVFLRVFHPLGSCQLGHLFRKCSGASISNKLFSSTCSSQGPNVSWRCVLCLVTPSTPAPCLSAQQPSCCCDWSRPTPELLCAVTFLLS